MNKPKIGIRVIIDGRRDEGIEEKAFSMAEAAKKLIEENVFYVDGTAAEVVIGKEPIGGCAESARVADQFSTENIVATLSVTPSWCYGTETMDMDPTTIKAVWGLNATERPGAVYLAAVMSAHAQRGLPAYSIYGQDVQDADDDTIPADVQEKILRFARCALAVGQMKGKSYVNFGGVSMGIMGSNCDANFMQKYLGIRAEWVDMCEILRRNHLEMYDHEEFERAFAWAQENCPIGLDPNPVEKQFSDAEKLEQLKFSIKMALIFKDVMQGNPKIAGMDVPNAYEQAQGRNAILGGFQGQRMWSDWQPVGDFAEAMLNTSFDWNGKRQQTIFATENDGLNGLSMLFGHLITCGSSVFADVRTYWSPDSVERITGWKPEGAAANGFIHLINSGAAALDGTGCSKDENGNPCMKPWWNMTEEDISACLKATEWSPASKVYFHGGGFSSRFTTKVEMPVTLVRINLIDGVGPVLQFVEGTTVHLPDEVDHTLYYRTDKTWPSTWFAPRLTKEGVCSSTYSIMANWGANHGAFCYGHVGQDLITLASMLRIPVALHNLDEDQFFRPHCWSAFGTKDKEAADFAACKLYGALYK